MAETAPRIVLVTGAAGGIGSAMVASLLAAGHRIAALDHDAKGLDALLAAHGSHSNLWPINADLSTAQGCEAGMAAAISHFGRVEVVVNNAGIGVSSRAGSVCLNSSWASPKCIPALVRPPSGLMAAR
jgi:NAD(P)-dependent dehydrogenase (short-subunit alcohol dehydrogenase family)